MTAALRDLDYTRLGGDSNDPQAQFARELVERAQARVAKFVPITVEDRFAAFARLGYRPHGLYVPSEDCHELRRDLQQRMQAVGEIGRTADGVDEMLVAYQALQDETERWAEWGIPGRWTGQQAVARSKSRFRIVAWGRRGGKTFHAAREALGVALSRPRALVWMCAPTTKLVSRGYDMVLTLIDDLSVPTRRRQNTKTSMLVELTNGAIIEGMSLENIWSAAGAAVDFAVLDEAAQLTPDAWYRGVHPTLMDKNGQALMISSWEGEEDFFAAQANKAKEREDPDWELFVGESWQNFFAFPEGRRSPSVQQAEREMPPKDFLEQYGAIPQNNGTLIYPQFKSAVHIVEALPHAQGDWEYDWFDPRMPVLLAVDPTGGANEYAVAAIQDFGDEAYIIDEYYVVGALTEEVVKVLDARPWRSLVGDVIIDSASPAEVTRWINCGYSGAFGVEDKPQIEDSIPIYRRLLRDPVRFRRFYLNKVNEKCQEIGLSFDEYEELPVETQHRIALEIEEDLADRPDRQLAQDDLDYLRRCSHIFVLKHCTFTIEEHKHYAYPRRRSNNLSLNENPRKWKDHIMDALRYWAWQNKRLDEEVTEGRVTSTIHTVQEVPLTVGEIAKLRRGEPLTPEPMEHFGFLWAMRQQYASGESRTTSYIRDY